MFRKASYTSEGASDVCYPIIIFGHNIMLGMNKTSFCATRFSCVKNLGQIFMVWYDSIVNPVKYSQSNLYFMAKQLRWMDDSMTGFFYTHCSPVKPGLAVVYHQLTMNSEAH
jgi:hypothetical protein